MCEAKDFPPSERDELMALVTQLQGQVAQLTAAKEELHKQVAELKRAGKRQAAPFSKGGRSSRPKRPGRKPGMGSFSYRKSPSPDEVTEPLVEVAVAEDTCPGCGGRLEHEGLRVVYATDIPPIPRPKVTRYRVQICRCWSCGKQVRGRHPDVAPDQCGASAHRVGRRVMAASHVLHYGVGVPVRKVPAVLRATPTVAVPTGTPTPVATPTRAPGTAPPTPTPVELGPAVVIGDVVLVELAITPEERRQGLSDRPSLAPGTGMLFVFESDGHRQFWMKNMHFPLDMVWIGSDCAVGSISGEVPASPPGTDDSDVVRVSPEEEAQYVMEINGGEAAALGLAANGPVSFAGTIVEQYGC